MCKATFCVQIGKSYTCLNCLHNLRLWWLWQIWGMITYPSRYIAHHLYITWHEVHVTPSLFTLPDMRYKHVTPSVKYTVYIQCTLPDIRYMPQSMLPTQETLPAGASKYLKHDQVFCHCLNSIQRWVIKCNHGKMWDFIRKAKCMTNVIDIASLPA